MGLIDSLQAYNEKRKPAVSALAENEMEMFNENKIEEREGAEKITAPLIAFANQVVQGRVLGAEQLTELRRVMEEIASTSAAPSPPGEVLLDYEQFIKISTICQASWERCDAPADPEIVNQLFQASTFLSFKRDHLGRISAKNFYEYVVRRNDMLKLRLELEEYDSDHDGVITESQLQSFIDDQLGDAAQTMEQLRAGGWDLREKYVQIALRKFLFFHGSKGRSRSAEQRILLVDLLASPVLEEFLDVHLPPDEAMHPSNWFSPRRVSKLVHRFGELDADGDGALTPAELRRFRTMYSGGEIAPSLTELFVERVFEEHVFGGGKKTRRSFLSTMSFSDYIDFELAWEYHTSPAGIAYFFRVLDVRHAGYITRQDIYTFFRDVYELWLGMELWDFNVHDVANEVFDMAAPGTPGRITLPDLCDCQLGGTICVMLVDVMCFYDYDQRESQSSSPSESDD